MQYSCRLCQQLFRTTAITMRIIIGPFVADLVGNIIIVNTTVVAQMVDHTTIPVADITMTIPAIPILIFTKIATHGVPHAPIPE
jgi:hypothetical protein